MGYDKAESYEDIDKSSYNEAALKMIRIHKLQEQVNVCSTNPLIFNQDYQCYNYQLMFRCLNSLYQEISDKLSKEKEIPGMTKMRKELKKFMKDHPIFKDKRDRDGKLSQVKEHDEAAFEILEEGLFAYETRIKYLAGKHGYGSPSEEGEGMF